MMTCRRTLLIALSVWFLHAAGLAAPGEAPEAVVAIVDRSMITRQEVSQRIAAAIKATSGPLTAEEEARLRTTMFPKAREGLIEEKLLVAEAERMLEMFEPFARKLDREAVLYLERERRRAGGHKEFNRMLREAGLTYKDYVERVRQEIMQARVLEQFVYRDLSVSPAETVAYYKKNIHLYKEPARVQCRQIFIRANRDPEKEGLDFDKARRTADYVMELLKQDHDFAGLARKYSDGPHAEEGGLWDFVGRGARPEAIDKLLFSLPVGQVGGPVETEIGYTIVKVQARQEARTAPFEEVQEQIERLLLREERLRRYQRLIARLEKEHHVERFD